MNWVKTNLTPFIYVVSYIILYLALEHIYLYDNN